VAISYNLFCALSSVEQYAAVWHEGTFLVRRYQGADAVNLYHMAGDYFAEVFYDHLTCQLRLVEGFPFYDRERLANYTSCIQLDNLIF